MDAVTEIRPRTGQNYIDAIKGDGRKVFIDGEEVNDVTTHPAFREAIKTTARLYDIASEPANRNLMRFGLEASPKTINRIWQLPKSENDLRLRRSAVEKWSEVTFGLMGRSPDHVAAFFCGWMMNSDVFEQNGGKEKKKYLENFYEYLSENDYYVTYTIIPPQIDRSKPMHQQSPRDLYAGVVKEKDNGIIVRGAQMLGTGAVLSDYISLGQITPIQPGDEDHAINFAVACNSPGLKIYSRRSYASAANSTFDYPLSSQFDETDSLVVFDDVFVPWEQVFVYRDLEISKDQWWKTAAHSMGNHQAQIRFVTKLRLIMGLAKRITEMNGVNKLPAVKGILGEMSSYAAMVEGLLDAQISNCSIIGKEFVEPARQPLYAAIALQSEVYPKLLNLLRELCGGGLIQLPSSSTDFKNPQIKIDIDRYIQSPGYPADERVKLMKLTWDLVGSEFAGRQEQYERFYAGPPFATKTRMESEYNFAEGERLVDDVLATYDIEGRK